MDAAALKCPKQLDEEKLQPKQMSAELSLDHKILKDIVQKRMNHNFSRYKTITFPPNV
jgi:putative transposase